MNTYTKLIFAICSVYLFSMPAYAIDLTGTRPLSMGGAFVAVSDDANAVFWNPAGMKQSEKNMMATNYHLDSDNIHPRGSFIIVNSKKKPLLDGGIGISRQRSVIKGIEYDKTNYVIALADQYAEHFSIGVSGKYMDQKTDNTSRQDVFSLDAGAILSLGDNFRIGITGYNLNDPSLVSYNRKVQVGAQIKLLDIIRIAGDGAKLFSEGNDDDEYNYSIGGEIALSKKFVLRGGYSEEKIYDNRYVGAGVGLLIAKVIIDYAYVHGLSSGAKEKHMLGMSYEF